MLKPEQPYVIQRAMRTSGNARKYITVIIRATPAAALKATVVGLGLKNNCIEDAKRKETRRSDIALRMANPYSQYNWAGQIKDSETRPIYA